jgi:ankyrin repeat protein
MEPRSDTESVVDKIRRGEISALDAFAAELPEVFAAEILPKLTAQDTLRLAQVNKLCRDTVWSEDNVRSLGAKFQETIPTIQSSVHWGEPIHWAAVHRVLPAVRALLKSEEEAYKKVTNGGLTALHYAVGCGFRNGLQSPPPNLEIIRLLIEAGADINKLTNDGRTPLRFAAMGQVEATKILIDAGADLNISSPLSAIQSYVKAFPVGNHQEFGREFYACAALLIKAGAYDSDSDFDYDDDSSLCSADKEILAMFGSDDDSDDHHMQEYIEALEPEEVPYDSPYDSDGFGPF